MARGLHVLIAGAGIGGLVAALALQQRGIRVELFEQAPEPREVGAGLQLAANATRVLLALGLGGAMDELASEPEGKEIRLWSDGRTWKLFDLAAESVKRYGAPYLMFHRADLHAILYRAVLRADPGAIHMAARVVGCSQAAGCVRLALADGRTVEGDVLIGADGVHSEIRRTLFGDGEAEFTGLMAWRGVVPAGALPAATSRPVGTNWIGPGRHVIQYPLRRGELVNFVGIVERDDWQVESWSAVGSREDCLADFAGWHEDVRALIRSIETPYRWAFVGRRPMASWIRARIALLGDACHPTLPFLAQGAGMAIEDGYVLARCLSALPEEPEAALVAYQDARLARTTRVVLGSAENGRRFHNPALAEAESAAAYVEREWQPERVRERYDWLFEYDAMRVAIPGLSAPAARHAS